MKTKIKKKRLILEPWHLEELEAWFADMASNGWHLVELSKGKAIFEEGEPRAMKYRCDTFQINALLGQDKLEENSKLGWHYIDSIGYVHVFREKDYTVGEEIYPDSRKHAQSLAILKRSLTIRALLITLLSVIMITLQINTFLGNLVHSFLSNSGLLTLMVIITFTYLSFHMFEGVFHLSRLISRLNNGIEFNHNINYKRKLTWFKLRIYTALSIGVAIMLLISLGDLFQKNDYQAIPEHDLPVIKLSTILENEGYRNVTYNFDTFFSDYYLEKSSFFVPRQYELRQSAKVVITGGPSYKPTIWSKRYEVRTNWLARYFFHSLVEQNVKFHGPYELINDPQFDELWIRDTDGFSSFIVRLGHEVFVVEYIGEEPVEVILSHSFWLNSN
ncbi:DUF2812 domain-containing protein [Anaerobacillus isosaccharinicus]|uniref:DUF2812 domain-containing protein n=1 Tax=Anaerobacillus isosaccharinicus TaxID=1532552 RepID=A0A1S2LET2_9BACI|nr:DUF2812 domain-containing protein [Anaerobacillus isosaccharinicus]MBA5586287.1 DUF2812 domain-containing protein [Anaerobacillus isosaccharinicus]QOY35462.1 DUF2812 domain-containing protein [Anaerobacillus isosaccharinicus]